MQTFCKSRFATVCTVRRSRAANWFLSFLWKIHSKNIFEYLLYLQPIIHSLVISDFQCSLNNISCYISICKLYLQFFRLNNFSKLGIYSGGLGYFRIWSVISHNFHLYIVYNFGWPFTKQLQHDIIYCIFYWLIISVFLHTSFKYRNFIPV